MTRAPRPSLTLVSPEEGRKSKALPRAWPIIIGEKGVAELAMQLVYAREYGEAGGKAAPAEIVDRAIEIAAPTFDRLIARGHAVVLPRHEDLEDEIAPMGFATGNDVPCSELAASLPLLGVLVGAPRLITRSPRRVVGPFYPVRNGGSAKLAALRAPHTRAER
jgi:hypothetical protein